MKYYVLAFAFTFIFFQVKAQSDLTASFNSNYSGINLTIDFSKTYRHKNEIGAGLRFNINQKGGINEGSHIFYKNLYSESVSQHFGFHAFYHRYLNQAPDCLFPFMFYDFQFSHSPTRNYFFQQIANSNTFQKITENFGPFFWIEQYVGLGLKIKLNNRLFLMQKIGGGAAFIIGKDSKLPATYDKLNIELAGIVQAGLIFRINSHQLSGR
jgi:hypothetical protein